MDEMERLARDLERYRRLRAICASDDRIYNALNLLIDELERRLQTTRRSREFA